jgi:hypothetical protein
MANRLFPQPVTNDYQGHPLAKWFFLLLLIITIVRSLIHMFAPDGGAQSIATIDLDSFSPQAADTVITMFALWGLSQLIIGLVYAVVFWRYQALIPLMYLTLLIEYSMRLLAPLYTPGITTTGTAPGAIGDYILVPVTLIMLMLSLRHHKTSVPAVNTP